MHYPSISSMKSASAFRARLEELELDLPFDEQLTNGSTSPFAQPHRVHDWTIGNRFCVLPMEGWDGTTDGRPTELTERRWRNFGSSGAKLIWGGEAVAVRHDGRANPRQLLINESTVGDLASLRESLVDSHRRAFAKTDDLVIGLQLTHSGRFAKPNDHHERVPRTVYRHPILDERVGIQDDRVILSDDELRQLTDDFIRAGQLAYQAGYDFVDIKHCHGYLGHELLSAIDRPGPFGGSLENRTQFLRDIVAGLRATVPQLQIGVRLSIFDVVPYQPGDDRVGVPVSDTHYQSAFGSDDLNEPSLLLKMLEQLGVQLICTTAGNPYAAPHISRPAAMPPSDGYLPPEDPLVGVARQIRATAHLKKMHPKMTFIGSAYSYLQEWLPHVAQRVIRDGGADFIGLGRMMLAYPQMSADILAGRPLDRKRICRTFSDCTTAPRNGLVSGCYPLDPYYREREEAMELKVIKRK